MKKKILIIVGSQRVKSFNMKLAKVIEAELLDQAEVSFLDYSQVPFLNLDIEYPTPLSVEKARQEVLKSDGIWIVTPQHNGSYPGLLKNLIDWLSRPRSKENLSLGTAIKGKKVTVSGVGGSSMTADCREKLRELFKRLNVCQMTDYEVGIGVPPKSFQTDEVDFTEEQLQQIQEQVKGFLDFLEQ